jgi:hypothetical protein
MLIASKNGRKIRAMVMNETVDQCRGVVQCALPGCEAYMELVEPGMQRVGGDVEDASPKEQVERFLEHHDCLAPSHRGGSPTARVAGRRWRPGSVPRQVR